MGISPVSAGGVNPAYNVSAAAPASASAVKSEENSAPAVQSDQVSLGEKSDVSENEAPKKKSGFLDLVKDLVLPDNTPPAAHISPLCSRRLDKIIAAAEPGDIPDSLPKHERKSGEPTDYYIPGGGSHSGISVSLPSEQVPTMADVADFKPIYSLEAEKDFGEQRLAFTLSRAQKSVIREYSDKTYTAMNHYLATGADNETGSLGKAVRCAAGALEQGTVPSGVILSRCASLDELRNYCTKGDYTKYKMLAKFGKTEGLAKLLNKKLTGTQTERKSFLSTSAGAADFKRNPKIITKFYVGEGVHGIYIAGDPLMARYQKEHEYLLAPNTPTTVMGVDYNPDTDGLIMHVFLGDKQ